MEESEDPGESRQGDQTMAQALDHSGDTDGANIEESVILVYGQEQKKPTSDRHDAGFGQNDPVQELEIAAMDPKQQTGPRRHNGASQKADQPSGSTFEREADVSSGPSYAPCFPCHGRGQHTVKEARHVAKDQEGNG
jgi:hypothetical protein